MDIRCDAQKTPTRIWTRTYTWRHWEKAGPRGFAGPGISSKSGAGFMRGCKLAPALLCATGREILQRFGGVAAFVSPPDRLSMSINLWGVYGMCKCLQACVCVCVGVAQSTRDSQPPHPEKNSDGLKYFISAVYVSANLHSI